MDKSTPSTRSASRQILMIDDEETIQTVVKFGLRLSAGWEMLAASSGPAGIELAKQHQPDAILLDVMMPEMDGVATFKVLQADPSTQAIPVIFLTAKAQATEKSQLKALGVSGVITKPFNSLDLPEQIAKILHWPLAL
ncbi:MAG: response regulator [Synechococcales cyanobacterium CRU_2_2]|nr:response regulator [Synechococcales cyanobacterium CRU_2_2]